MFLAGLVTVASAGCTFGDSCPRKTSRVTDWLALGVSEAPPTYTYVAVSLSSCRYVLEADIITWQTSSLGPVPMQ